MSSIFSPFIQEKSFFHYIANPDDYILMQVLSRTLWLLRGVLLMEQIDL